MLTWVGEFRPRRLTIWVVFDIESKFQVQTVQCLHPNPKCQENDLDKIPYKLFIYLVVFSGDSSCSLVLLVIRGTPVNQNQARNKCLVLGEGAPSGPLIGPPIRLLIEPPYRELTRIYAQELIGVKIARFYVSKDRIQKLRSNARV